MKLIILIGMCVLILLSGCGNPYCETHFGPGVVEECKIVYCHLSGCDFKCKDGSRIVTTEYIQRCD